MNAILSGFITRRPIPLVPLVQLVESLPHQSVDGPFVYAEEYSTTRRNPQCPWYDTGEECFCTLVHVDLSETGSQGRVFMCCGILWHTSSANVARDIARIRHTYPEIQHDACLQDVQGSSERSSDTTSKAPANGRFICVQRSPEYLGQTYF